MREYSAEVCRESGSRLLLVEGRNDCHVVMALANARGLERRFGIYECGNKGLVLSRLNALVISAQKLEILGAVLDANAVGAARCWQSVRQKLGRYSYKFEEGPEIGGSIVSGERGEPRLGIWIMPDNENPGNLEGFCLSLLSEAESAAAQEAVDLGVARGVATFKPSQRSKAIVHTFLAWQDEPGRPLGQSITGGRLAGSAEMAGLFVSWLERLFWP